MAFPLPPGLTPPEIAFLCEMEMVTIVPRQRLERLELLGGPTQPLNPPHRALLPLWLALLLKRQRRCNIVPPPWLAIPSLDMILTTEKEMSSAFSPPPPNNTSHPSSFSSSSSSPARPFRPSPPFINSCTADAPADALPYHWVEFGEILLEAAPDDIPESDNVRGLMRDLREIRMAKMRAGVEVLDGGGGGVEMTGVGAMELGEGRAFISGVVNELRKIGASKEQAMREREAEERMNGYEGTQDDDDDDMEFSY